jgi:DMSO/TMAO reductase YedYZ molybdopterin-dependent catalytic subunit
MGYVEVRPDLSSETWSTFSAFLLTQFVILLETDTEFPAQGGTKMTEMMRIMTERPLNAETPISRLRSWVTANSVFFDRNQGDIPQEPVDPSEWRLTLEGLVEKPVEFTLDQILHMPKAIVSNTLECSGNSRSLLREKASGNPWTIGGAGNAVWGGVWLKDLLGQARPQPGAKHVAFQGMDKPIGSAGVPFIRSIPLEKADSSTLLAYEMNGDPLPLKHGYPLRALALGWTGANCVKWLRRITLLSSPFEGFFMDKVYRVFQKDQDPKTGQVVTGIKLKSTITQPLPDEALTIGPVTILGAAYAGEGEVDRVEVSVDGGNTWNPAAFIGPHEKYAWRHWQFIWHAKSAGDFILMARARDKGGAVQPLDASWNVLGYGNNGVREHAVRVHVT